MSLTIWHEFKTSITETSIRSENIQIKGDTASIG